ncbi:MAG: EscU/YscU/HrcU family type III secretion system export apparatus switch protein [Kofleriaceae bacterium]|nr:EscU/YscU/HrcU family type III secretion system export apparatus switch protein [Kofleriaceae bacterium]
MERTHAASAKRLQASKASGLIAHSSMLTWAGATTGAAIASWQLLPSVRAVVSTGIEQAVRLASEQPTPPGADSVIAPLTILRAAGQQHLGVGLTLGGSIACAAAMGALLVHLAMVRSGWLPRRPRQDAALVPDTMAHRAGYLTAWALAAVVSLLVLGGWVWRSAPVLAAPLQMVATSTVVAVCTRALAITVVTLLLATGALHLLLRVWQIHAAQRMTKPELERERRDASVSPAIRQAMRRLAGQAHYVPTLICYDHQSAVAIAWHAATMIHPVLVWHHRDAASRQSVRDAQRGGTTVRRDLALTQALRNISPGEVIPQAHWPALAAAVASIK